MMIGLELIIWASDFPLGQKVVCKITNVAIIATLVIHNFGQWL